MHTRTGGEHTGGGGPEAWGIEPFHATASAPGRSSVRGRLSAQGGGDEPTYSLLLPTPPPLSPEHALPVPPGSTGGHPAEELEPHRESLWKRVNLAKVIMLKKPFSAIATVFSSKNAAEIFAELRNKRALELAAQEAAAAKAHQENSERARRDLEERAQKQSERWRQTLEDTEIQLYNEALERAMGQHVTDLNGAADSGRTSDRALREESLDKDDSGLQRPETNSFEDLASSAARHGEQPSERSRVVEDLNEATGVKSQGHADQDEQPVALGTEARRRVHATVEETRQVVAANGQQREDVSVPRGETELPDQIVMSDERPRYRRGETQTSKPGTKPNRSELRGVATLVEDEADENLRRLGDKACLTSAAIAVKARKEHHMRTLLATEEDMKTERRTARFMLPARKPDEPEMVLEQAKQFEENQYDFRRQYGDGRPRCSAGSAMLPHFPTLPSHRPRELISDSKEQLKLFVSKRSIPQTPPHWGVVLEPRVMRGHLRKDESLSRIRNAFRTIFAHVGEAFVFCDSYRVGYIELASMKARLMQIGLTSRPDDVNGLDLERVFLLATGKNTAIMQFNQFCRQFTWHYPLTPAQERALQRRAAAPATEMSESKKASMYASDIQAIRKMRQHGALPLVDEIEEMLIEPSLFEQFCVIEGHSSLQMGARRLTMDQKEWLSLLVDLRLLPQDAIKQMFKSQKVGESMGEKTEDGESGPQHENLRVASVQKKLRRKLTKEEALTAFFAGDTSEEKDGEMNFREYIAACQEVAEILGSDGPRTHSPEVEEDVFDLEGWWRGFQQKEAMIRIQARVRCRSEIDKYKAKLENHIKLQQALGKGGASNSADEADKEDQILRVMHGLLQLVEQQVEQDNRDEVTIRGVQRTMESLVEALEDEEKEAHEIEAAEKAQQDDAHELHLQTEVAACLDGLVARIMSQADAEMLEDTQRILSQEPGFFKEKLIAAIAERERIMATAVMDM